MKKLLTALMLFIFSAGAQAQELQGASKMEKLINQYRLVESFIR